MAEEVAPEQLTSEQFMPVLSAGRHRSARRGACFMEYASFLAGHKWSDHPDCTHPSLAAVARLVNDLTADGVRSRLAVHIASVIGLRGDDERVPLVLAALAASTALPIASLPRQRALATALVRCESELDAFDGPVIDRARLRIRVAFLLAPGTEQWARSFIGETALGVPQSDAINEQAVLRTAIVGIADACIPDPDARLALLLEQSIDECAAMLSPVLHPVIGPLATAIA